MPLGAPGLKVRSVDNTLHAAPALHLKGLSGFRKVVTGLCLACGNGFSDRVFT